MYQTNTIKLYYKSVIMIPTINLANNYVVKSEKRNETYEQSTTYCHIIFMPAVWHCIQLYYRSEVKKKSKKN